jgi:alanine racemase
VNEPAEHRPTEAVVDIGAIRHNVAVLAERARPAELCVVVKADGYGHGTVPVARAALEAGATWLAVALAEEAIPLRGAGIDAPILLLAEPSPAEAALAVELGLEVAVYRPEAVTHLAEAAGGTAVPVHLKVDTGMHRVGCSPDDALGLARSVQETPGLHLAAVWTHCARADEPGEGFTALQIERYRRVLDELGDAGVEVPLRHAANSAALLAFPESHFDLCRAGIAVYGIDPGPLMAGMAPLRPALSLRSTVAHVHRVAEGEGISYGHRYLMPAEGWVAVAPVGYADGVPRRLPDVGGEVLVGGRRRPIAGAVTMDQVCIDCGDHRPEVGDEVVLIGRQGDEEITAADWAERLGTITYEVVCGVGSRVPRRYRDGPC